MVRCGFGHGATTIRLVLDEHFFSQKTANFSEEGRCLPSAPIGVSSACFLLQALGGASARDGGGHVPSLSPAGNRGAEFADRQPYKETTMQRCMIKDKRCATCRWWWPVLFWLVAIFALGTPSFARAATNDSTIAELHVSKVSTQANETSRIDYSFRQVPKDAADIGCLKCGVVILVVTVLISWILTRRYFRPKDGGIEISNELFSFTLQSVIAGAFWILALIIMAMCLLGGICWAVHSHVPCCLIAAFLALSVVPILLLLAAMGALLSAKVHKKE
jgi:hypothetical protein